MNKDALDAILDDWETAQAWALQDRANRLMEDLKALLADAEKANHLDLVRLLLDAVQAEAALRMLHLPTEEQRADFGLGNAAVSWHADLESAFEAGRRGADKRSKGPDANQGYVVNTDRPDFV